MYRHITSDQLEVVFWIFFLCNHRETNMKDVISINMKKWIGCGAGYPMPKKIRSRIQYVRLLILTQGMVLLLHLGKRIDHQYDFGGGGLTTSTTTISWLKGLQRSSKGQVFLIVDCHSSIHWLVDVLGIAAQTHFNAAAQSHSSEWNGAAIPSTAATKCTEPSISWMQGCQESHPRQSYICYLSYIKVWENPFNWQSLPMLDTLSFWSIVCDSLPSPYVFAGLLMYMTSLYCFICKPSATI